MNSSSNFSNSIKSIQNTSILLQNLIFRINLQTPHSIMQNRLHLSHIELFLILKRRTIKCLLPILIFSFQSLSIILLKSTLQILNRNLQQLRQFFNPFHLTKKPFKMIQISMSFSHSSSFSIQNQTITFFPFFLHISSHLGSGT